MTTSWWVVQEALIMTTSVVVSFHQQVSLSWTVIYHLSRMTTRLTIWHALRRTAGARWLRSRLVVSSASTATSLMTVACLLTCYWLRSKICQTVFMWTSTVSRVISLWVCQLTHYESWGKKKSRLRLMKYSMKPSLSTTRYLSRQRTTISVKKIGRAFLPLRYTSTHLQMKTENL